MMKGYLKFNSKLVTRPKLYQNKAKYAITAVEAPLSRISSTQVWDITDAYAFVRRMGFDEIIVRDANLNQAEKLGVPYFYTDLTIKLKPEIQRLVDRF